MFTGLIEAIGAVVVVEPLGDAARIVIDGGELVRKCQVGNSIAVNGVCLTAAVMDGARFTVTAVEETLRRTTLGNLRAGGHVNLELPLLPTSRLGGHFVQGHVDGKAIVTAIESEGEGVSVTLRVPASLARYLAEKGSVALDGVSLTVARAHADGFAIALIPHTRAVTTLGALSVGDEVNVEVDVLAKYAERLQTPTAIAAGLTEARLRELGY